MLKAVSPASRKSRFPMHFLRGVFQGMAGNQEVSGPVRWKKAENFMNAAGREAAV